MKQGDLWALECGSSSGCQHFLILSRGSGKHYGLMTPTPASHVVFDEKRLTCGARPVSPGPFGLEDSCEPSGAPGVDSFISWPVTKLLGRRSVGGTTPPTALFLGKGIFCRAVLLTEELNPRYRRQPWSHFHGFAWLRARFLHVCGPPSKAFKERIYQCSLLLQQKEPGVRLLSAPGTGT